MGGAVSVPVTAVVGGKTIGAYCNGNKDSTVFCSGPANVTTSIAYQCSPTSTEDKYYCALPNSTDNYSCTIIPGNNNQTNFKCRKTNSSGLSNRLNNYLGPSGTVTPVPSGTPPIITTPVSVNATSVQLSWLPATNIPTGYTLAGYQITKTVGTTVSTIPSNGTSLLSGTSYQDTAVTAGTGYSYFVAAEFTQPPQTTWSTLTSQTVNVAPIAGPVLSVVDKSGTAVLTWTAPTGVASPTYTVWRSDQPAPITTGLTTLTYTDSTVKSNTKYSYQVYAVGGVTATFNGTSQTNQEAVLSNSVAVTSSSSKTWLWILLGVLGFIFLLILIGGLIAAMR